jgi:hypothetical protein
MITSFSRFGLAFLYGLSAIAQAAPPTGSSCQSHSTSVLTPVIELYTSEGCSSCPPVDKWVSTLKAAASEGRVVVESFHVGYWDYIGWVDRFATPAHMARQREVAALNHLGGIYTPQVIRNGQDWRNYAAALGDVQAARATIVIQGQGQDAYEAIVAPADTAAAWSAYWTVTEHGHSSRVKAGENNGEYLQHDFVVREYVPVGTYRGTSRLSFRAIAADPRHPRQVNLVVFDTKNGKPLQALSVGC